MDDKPSVKPSTYVSGRTYSETESSYYYRDGQPVDVQETRYKSGTNYEAEKEVTLDFENGTISWSYSYNEDDPFYGSRLEKSKSLFCFNQQSQSFLMIKEGVDKAYKKITKRAPETRDIKSHETIDLPEEDVTSALGFIDKGLSAIAAYQTQQGLTDLAQVTSAYQRVLKGEGTSADHELIVAQLETPSQGKSDEPRTMKPPIVPSAGTEKTGEVEQK